MSHLSLRCQREQELNEQDSEFSISEVIDVMRELDLMDVIRAKCDGNLQKLTFMLTNSGFEEHFLGFDPSEYGVGVGVDEGKASSPMAYQGSSSPGFATNFVAKDEDRPDEPKDGDGALTSVWNTEIKRSNSSDPMVPPRESLISSSYDEIDMSTTPVSPLPPINSGEDEKSFHSGRGSHLSAQSTEYSGRAAFQIPVDDDIDDVEIGRAEEVDSAKVENERPKSEKKKSFFSRALVGLMGGGVGSSQDVVAEKYKAPEEEMQKPEAEAVNPGGDIETGARNSHVFMRRNSETENAPRNQIRRGSTNAEKERELTRKASIRTSQALAKEAMEKMQVRRNSQVSEDGDAVTLTSGEIDEHVAVAGSAGQSKSPGGGGAASALTSAQSSARKSNRANEKVNML